MITGILLFIALVAAVEWWSDILVNAPPLERARAMLDGVPVLRKLARCKYCQTAWMCLACAMAFPIPEAAIAAGSWAPVVKTLVLWGCMHRACMVWWEFLERYLSRAPARLHLSGSVSRPPTAGGPEPGP